jgi:dipeptidyl aminopeptidase/acylaminoacyl peptidase
VALALGAGSAGAQAAFSIRDILSPAFPYSLQSAKNVDRIVWAEFERGMRNVYTAAPPDFSPRRITNYLEDDGVDLQELQISNDGEIVTFLRGHGPNDDGWIANPSSDPRGAERAVWAASTQGGNAWRVVEANDYVLSPDGRWVAYEKNDQIWRAPVNSGMAVGADAGAPFFVAFGENRDPRWSPDGNRIAFVSVRGDHSYIGVYDARGPAITYLAPGVDRDSSPTWSPDGTQIAFLRRPGLPFGASADLPEDTAALPSGLLDSRFSGGHELEIWVADVRTGEGHRLWQAPVASAEQGDFSGVRQIRWQGDHVVFEAEPHNWRHWYSISVKEPSDQLEELTLGEGFVEHVAFSSDGRYLYYASNVDDIDYRDLWRVPVSGGDAERLTEGHGIETYPAVLSSGDQVAVLYADYRQPLSVALVEADGGDAEIVTSVPAAYPLQAHVEPQNVVIAAADSLEFHNQLFLPPDLEPGERRPALVFIHGGSRRQMLLGYHYMHFYHMAYAMNQYWAHRGYVVLSVNYRSGIGYGANFRNAEGRGGEGNTEYRDILAAGKYLQSRSDVDPARVGLWGLSYGGVLTAQALARNSDVFTAGVDMAGVHLWGNSLDPGAVSYQSSAIAAIEDWTSPVFLIHGDDDRNVDFAQTVGLVQLLRAHEVPFELMVLPDDVHDSLLFSRWIDIFEASNDFLERTLVRGERIAAESAQSP